MITAWQKSSSGCFAGNPFTTGIHERDWQFPAFATYAFTHDIRRTAAVYYHVVLTVYPTGLHVFHL